MEQRQCYTFFLSFYDAIVDLKDKDQLQVYRAITEYGLFGVVPEISGVAMSIFKAVKPNIDSSNKRRESGRKGGLAGGAPVGNQNASKNKANSNQNKANSNQNQTNIKENIKYEYEVEHEVEVEHEKESKNEFGVGGENENRSCNKEEDVTKTDEAKQPTQVKIDDDMLREVLEANRYKANYSK